MMHSWMTIMISKCDQSRIWGGYPTTWTAI